MSRIYYPVSFLTSEQQITRRANGRRRTRAYRVRKRQALQEAISTGKPLPRQATSFIRSRRFQTHKSYQRWNREGRPSGYSDPPPPSRRFLKPPKEQPFGKRRLETTTIQSLGSLTTLGVALVGFLSRHQPHVLEAAFSPPWGVTANTPPEKLKSPELLDQERAQRQQWLLRPRGNLTRGSPRAWMPPSRSFELPRKLELEERQYLLALPPVPF